MDVISESGAEEPVVGEAQERDGLRVLVRRVSDAPVVALRLWARGGSSVESIPGLAAVTGRMLSEGTKRRDHEQLAGDLESRGVSLSSYGGVEIHGLSLDALSEDWPTVLEVAGELWHKSTFDLERLEHVREQAKSELLSSEDQPDVKTSRAFLEQIYAPHALARPALGSAESLERVDPRDCIDLHRSCRACETVVSVAGDIDEDAVREALRERFAAAIGSTQGTADAPHPSGTPDTFRVVELTESQQAHLVMGHLTIPRRHEDLAALELLAVVLGAGSGLGGRLPGRLREQDGLAYSVQTHTVAGAGDHPGRFFVYLGIAPESVDAALEGVRSEIERLLDGGVSVGEVDEARSYLKGRELFRRETARQWADLMAEARIHQVACDSDAWADRWDISSSEVEAAARRHLSLDQLRVTLGKPAE